MNVPALIDRFTVLECLGSGATSTVYKAYDPRADRLVTLKVAGQLVSAADEMPPSLVREAEVAAKLEHPGIVSVYELLQHGPTWILVSEYAAGTPLDRFLSERRFDVSAAVRLVASLSKTIAYAHRQGVTHRDLKPANIILCRGDADDRERSESCPTGGQHDGLSARLIDFGVAEIARPAIDESDSANVAGTLCYTSPEQAAGRLDAKDHRVDIYSLGVLLYELLTGELPFRGTPHVLRNKIITEPAQSPRQLNAFVPSDLETITLKCLEKEPHRRFADADALADELDRWLGGYPILSRPPSWLDRGVRWCRRNPAIATLAGSLLTILLVGSTVVWRRWDQAERQRRSLESSETQVAENRKLVLAEQRALVEATNDAQAAEKRADQRRQIAAEKTAEADRNAALAERQRLRAEHNRRIIERGINQYRVLLTGNPRILEPRYRQLREFLLEEIENYAADELPADSSQLAGGAPPKSAPERPSLSVPQQADWERFVQLREQARARMLAEQWREAEEFVEQAMVQAKRLTDTPQGSEALAECQLLLGVIHYRQQRSERAERAFRSGIASAEQAIVDCPDQLAAHQTLASLYGFLGEICYRTDREAEAAKAYSQAIEIKTAMLGLDPENVEHQRNVSQANNNLGIMYSRMQQPLRAAKHYRAAIKIDEQLVERFPDNHEDAVNLAGALCNLGGVLPEPAKSLACFDRAITYLTSVREQQPAEPLAIAFLINSYEGRAGVLREQGRTEEADRDLASVRALQQQLRP